MAIASLDNYIACRPSLEDVPKAHVGLIVKVYYFERLVHAAAFRNYPTRLLRMPYPQSNLS